MKKLIVVFAVITIFTACTSTKSEQKTVSEQTTVSAIQIEFVPGEDVIIEELFEMTAIVVDVDRENRILTIVDADDVLTIFNVIDVVRNFDQGLVGDSVGLSGYHALMMQLAEPGEEIEESTIQLLAKASPGENSAMVEVDVVGVLAEITDIDNPTRMITVTGPYGNSVELIVPEHIEKFNELKMGDKVNGTHAQASAISVQVMTG